MTFKGKYYESIIDIERLLLIEEKRLDAYTIEMKFAQVIRNREKIKELAIQINLQEKFVAELKSVEEEIIDTIEKLAVELDEKDDLVLIRKFVYGFTNTKIMEELNISKSTLKRSLDRINALLQDSYYGSAMTKFLQNEM